MSTSGMTFEEISESVTGFDELAVEKHLSMDIYTDAERKPVGLMRALVFVHMRHNGVPDKDAKQQALEMTLKAVNDYFEESDETVPDAPETEAGKGDSQLVSTPQSSQPSAS